MIQAASQPQELLSQMDSLADATRLRLLLLLQDHELGVTELCDVLQMPQSTVSRHLKLLADQGWTRSRRQATTNLYHMPVEELDSPARRLWVLTREQTDNWATVQQDQLRLSQCLQRRQTDAQSFFSGAANNWDHLRQQLYGLAFSQTAMHALLPSHWVIADLGCGTALTTAQLAQHVSQVIGVDQSTAMLKAARKRTAGLKNVQIRRGDLNAIPIDDASCDAAILLLVLTYVADPRAVLHETARILQPGGKAVMVDLLPHDRDDFRRQMGQHCLGLAPDHLGSILHEAGLAKVRYQPLPPQPHVKGPALLLTTAIREQLPDH